MIDRKPLFAISWVNGCVRVMLSTFHSTRLRHSDTAKNTKSFRAYAREAMIDTLTLYLHGLCCDLDVEAGPRQLASRHLRRRLELLRELFPPPRGVAVFPEELP